MSTELWYRIYGGITITSGEQEMQVTETWQNKLKTKKIPTHKKIVKAIPVTGLHQSFLVTASNSGVSSASSLQSSLNGGSLPTVSLFFTDSLTELTWLPQLSSL
jgi:hypothetical protein